MRQLVVVVDGINNCYTIKIDDLIVSSPLICVNMPAYVIFACFIDYNVKSVHLEENHVKKEETNNMSTNTQELLTVAEVARILRCDDTTVRRWIKLGVLEAVTLPSPTGQKQGYRIKKSTLDKLLGNQS